MNLWGGAYAPRPYYAAEPQCAIERGSYDDDQCGAMTASGKRCKLKVSSVEPAASRHVCDKHMKADVVMYEAAHPKTKGPKAKRAKEFYIFFQALVKTSEGETMVASNSQVTYQILPAIRDVLMDKVGVPENTKITVALVENKEEDGCGGPFMRYGDKPTVKRNPQACGEMITEPPKPPSEYCIVEIVIPNPQPDNEAYYTPEGFFSSDEGVMIVNALSNMMLPAEFMEWVVDKERDVRASFEWDVVPNMTMAGGPCDALKANRTKA